MNVYSIDYFLLFFKSLGKYFETGEAAENLTNYTKNCIISICFGNRTEYGGSVMETYSAVNFADVSVWRSVLLITILLLSLLAANILKTKIPLFKRSLIPNSVLGGMILLIISSVCYYTTGDYLFNLKVFSENSSGITTLEGLTYHCLAIGFIAMTLRPVQKKLKGNRTTEILNSGCMTIGTYVIQAILGITITVIASLVIQGFSPSCGVLLCFGYGQGTGQALNIGKNFDIGMGTSGYSSFGLTIAALGFLTASIAGVLALNIFRKNGKLKFREGKAAEEIFSAENEPPVNESVDKLSIQLALVALAYLLAYGMMYLLGNVIIRTGNFVGTIYGFNFLFGVLAAVLVKKILDILKKTGLLKRNYPNSFLLNRISGFAFDIMIVAGICAIQIHLIQDYIGVILLLGVAGAVSSWFYVKFVCERIFPAYAYEQFLAFFGMLTGTASTGMILLREADPGLESPVSENLVYQNFPAIILALPLLFIANYLTTNAASRTSALIMLGVLILVFIILNLFIFRSRLHRKAGGKA